MLRHWHPLWVTVALLCAATALPAQSVRVEDLGVGKLLVARRDLPDPNFSETVILLVKRNEGGTLGLVINRKTKVPVSQALRQLKGADNWSDPVYLGGPVHLPGVLALLRSKAAKDETKPVLGEVYLVSSKQSLEKMLAEGPSAVKLHFYLGHSGWAAGQLENEVKLRSWYIFEGSAGAVFDSDPASLWSRLISQTEERYARARIPVRMAVLRGAAPDSMYRLFPAWTVK